MQQRAEQKKIRDTIEKAVVFSQAKRGGMPYSIFIF
jgi:hypothetical protein